MLRKIKGDTRKVVPDYFLPHNVNFKANKEARWNYINKMHNLYLNGPDLDDNITMVRVSGYF